MLPLVANLAWFLIVRLLTATFVVNMILHLYIYMYTFMHNPIIIFITCLAQSNLSIVLGRLYFIYMFD